MADCKKAVKPGQELSRIAQVQSSQMSWDARQLMVTTPRDFYRRRMSLSNGFG